MRLLARASAMALRGGGAPLGRTAPTNRARSPGGRARGVPYVVYLHGSERAEPPEASPLAVPPPKPPPSQPWRARPGASGAAARSAARGGRRAPQVSRRRGV